MHDSKYVNLPLGGNFKLSKEQCPMDEPDIKYMKNVPYANVLEYVMYLMVCTGPMWPMLLVSSLGLCPILAWIALKWLLGCLRKSSQLGLCFKACNEGVGLKGYVVANFAGVRDNRKCTTACMFTLYGTCISRKSHINKLLLCPQLKLNICLLLKL